MAIDEADLQHKAMLAAKHEYEGQVDLMGLVDSIPILSAYAGGFYMAYRYVEKTGKRVRFWKIQSYAKAAAEQYVATHNFGASPAIIKKVKEKLSGPVTEGFLDGLECAHGELLL